MQKIKPAVCEYFIQAANVVCLYLHALYAAAVIKTIMGIIRKQSIYSSVFTYLGFIIGAANLYFLSSEKYFLPNQYGLTRVLLDVSLLFSSVSILGSNAVAIKFYPFYNDYLPRKKNDLPLLTICACLIGCFFVLLTTTVFRDLIIRKFGAKSPLFVTHFSLIYPLTFILTFLSLFEAYAWSLRKTVAANFLKEVSFRIVVSVLIFLYLKHFISIETFFSAYSFIYLPGVAVLLIILISSGKFPLNFSISSVTKKLKNKMLSFGLFLFSGTVLNVVSKTVDLIIIASQSIGGLSDAAVFATATYFITVMEVPQRSIIAIGTPIIAEAWKDRNLKQILVLYQKTSLNLLIAGLAIWGCVMLVIDNIISILGQHYAPMKHIIFVMGIAKLIDLGTGLNTQILVLSKYWRVDFITNMLFIVLSIPLNYTLINHYGVTGSAYANFIALTVFNSVRFFFIWKLFKIQPFTLQTLYALLIAFMLMAAVYLLPAMPLYIDIIIRAALYVLLFGAAIIFFKVSPDVHDFYHFALNKIRKR